MDRTKRITRYFREALQVKECDAVDLNQQDKFWILNPEEYRQGLLSPALTEEIINQKYKTSPGKKGKRPECVDVILIPKTIRKISDEEGAEIDRGFKDLTGLFFMPARLWQDGALSFHTNCRKLPWIPRELLEPMVEPQLCIGHSLAYNEYLDRTLGQAVLIDSWTAYRHYAEQMYEEITHSGFQEDTLTVGEPVSGRGTGRSASALPTDRTAPEGERMLRVALNADTYICLDPTVQASQAIITLYDDLIDNTVSKPLYEKFLSGESRLSPLLPADSVADMQMHAGQMTGEHPLSESQREALYHFQAMEDGEILAVSGPPGTGKTTLVQSVVADRFVQHALRKEKAPLIVAFSTNNQAITNIIDSFGSIKAVGTHTLEKRWIAEVNSFATYFPSLNKMGEAYKKRYQYSSVNADGFAQTIDSEENLEQSEKIMLENCSLYFDTPFEDIDACREALHAELVRLHEAGKKCLSVFEETKRFTGGVSFQTFVEGLNHLCRQKEETIRQAEKKSEALQRQIDSEKGRIRTWDALYDSFPWYVRSLSFVPSFRKKIQTRLRLEKNAGEMSFLDGDLSIDDIRERYSYRLQTFHRQINRLKEEIEANRTGQQDLAKKKQEADRLRNAYLKEIEIIRRRNETIFRKENLSQEKQECPPDPLLPPVWEEYFEKGDLKKLNEWLDATARYIAFWLAVHYYECRWIQKEDILTENQRGKNFDNTLRSFYRRLSMVTPCLVMTFFMLPKNFRAYDGNTKKNFHLFNEIDLLIVDEAGQVTPEIAAASFALARKAVVVGDESQLEPVWGVPRPLDIAMALQYGLIDRKEEFEAFSGQGLNCSASSVMKVAKEACRYRKEPVRGLFLSEHRRCYDEIIQFSNELLYHKCLQPKRGKGEKDARYPLRPLPHMGYREITTERSSRSGLSRVNETEAREIARWIRINFPLLYAAYKQQDPRIEANKVLAVITPFKAQVRMLMRQFRKELPAEVIPHITVGTVHTFQGGERKVVLFSTVYGAQESGYFIEKNPNLLNVAVSRAKDSFLIFGARDCLKGKNGRLLRSHTRHEISSMEIQAEEKGGE